MERRNPAPPGRPSGDAPDPGRNHQRIRVAGGLPPAFVISDAERAAGHTIEDVKAQSTGPTFYQLYLAGGRGVIPE